MPLPDTAIQKIEASLGFSGIAGMTNPSACLVILADIVLYDKTAEAEVTIGDCMARPAWNGSGAPAGVQYAPRLIVPRITQTALAGGQPAHSSVATWGTFGLVDIDGYYRGNNATSTDWLDRSLYDWRRVTLRVGVNPDSYSDFDVVDSYRFIGPPASNGILVNIASGPALLDQSAPAYDSIYPGFDCMLDSTDGSLSVQMGSDQNIAADEDFYLRFRFKQALTATSAVLHSNRAALGAGNDGMTAYLTAASALTFAIADGSAEFEISDSGVYDDDTQRNVQIWGDRATDLLKGEIDGVAFTTDGVDISTMGAVTNTTAALLFKRPGGDPLPLTGAIDEFVLHTGVGICSLPGFADLRKQHREAPASWRDVGAQYVLHFDEDNGATAQNAYDPTLGTAVDVPLNYASTGSTGRAIDMGDNHNMDASASFTLVVTARSLASGALQGLLTKKASGAAGAAGFALYLSAANALEGMISDGATQQFATGAVTTADGVVRAYALVVDRSAQTISIYESDSSRTVWAQIGSSVDITSVGDSTSATSLLAGDFGSSNFNGDIFSYSIYTSALTTADLARLTPFHPSQADESTLAGHWPLNEGTGTTAEDAVGSVDGTIGAGASWATRHGTITHGTAGPRTYSASVQGSGGWAASLTGSYRTVNGLYGAGGRSKPQGYGYIIDSPVQWVDVRDHDYSAVSAGLTHCIVGQFNHGPYTCQELISVKQGGVEAGGSDYVIDIANGLLYWVVTGGYPTEPIRVTYKGMAFNGGGYSDRLGLITREWMTTNGLLTAGEFPAASATDFDAAFPYPVGVYIRGGLDKPEAAAAVLKRSLPAPGLLWSTDMEGDTFLLGRSLTNPDDYAADITLTDKVLADRPSVSNPAQLVYRVSVGYAERVAPLNSDDLLGTASVLTRDRDSQQWSYATATSSTLTSEDGRELMIPSPLTNQADAQAWANTILAAMDGGMFVQVKPARHLWEVYVMRAGRTRPDVVSLQSAYAAGLSVAQNFHVLGFSYTPKRSTAGIDIALDLWRP